MDYNVKKGLDKPLKIQGMLLKYFYAWCVIGVISIFVIIYMIIGASSPKSNITFVNFILTLIICAGIFLCSKVLFVNKSRKTRLNFKKTVYKESILSNIDIMKTLK